MGQYRSKKVGISEVSERIAATKENRLPSLSMIGLRTPNLEFPDDVRFFRDVALETMIGAYR